MKHHIQRIRRGCWRYNPLRGFSPISSMGPNDIVVVGYPKSGNTWLQVLISGVVYGISPLRTPDSVVQELVPDIHETTYYRRYQSPMFFKSHHLPRRHYRRVIYLLRDGRDVMVSYLHHLRAMDAGSPISLKEMIEAGKGLFPCHWHEHVSAWQSNPYAADLITVKYEDLLEQPVRELQRICAFAQADCPYDLIERIVRESRFENMRAREQRLGWANPHWPKDVPFVRQGKADAWRDEFPPECLAAFMRQAGDTLRKYGYLPN